MGKSRFNKYNDMSVEQLKQQQAVLRDTIDNGKRTFGQKVLDLLTSVAAGTISGIVASQTVGRRSAPYVGGTVGLAVAIPSFMLSRRYSRNVNAAHKSAELTHVERLLNEKVAAAKGSDQQMGR